MTTLREGDLQLHLPETATGRRFDGPSHGLSHCMKAIDFVVEYEGTAYFIEFKDPEHPSAQVRAQAQFLNEFQSGVIQRELVQKFRDTFLYEWAAERLTDKPIHYLVLVAISNLDAALLLSQTDALRRSLPVDGPKSGSWTRQIAHQCGVLNIETWNRLLPDFPVSRRSDI